MQNPPPDNRPPTPPPSAPPPGAIDLVLASMSARATHRAWVISDLQQSRPAEARRCLAAAVSDFRKLGLPCDVIWYLGDAIEGRHLPHLLEMTGMQVELLGGLGVPLRYVTGNHDFDYARHAPLAADRPADRVVCPFWEAVPRVPGWRTTARLEDFFFLDELGPYRVAFFSDHADPAGRWVSTHGKVHGEAGRYPHGPEAYRGLARRLEAEGRPLITAGHYAFPGGNRPSDLLARMAPLPANLRLHLYGHAHIGDGVWAGANLHRKVSGTAHHPAVQVDVASLEDERGDAIRSAVLEVHADLSLALAFRDHSARRWTEMLLLAGPGDPGTSGAPSATTMAPPRGAG